MLPDDRESASDVLCHLRAGICLGSLVERGVQERGLFQQRLGALVQASRRDADCDFEFFLTQALMRRHSHFPVNSSVCERSLARPAARLTELCDNLPIGI
jgi:hypothetical protein